MNDGYMSTALGGSAIFASILCASKLNDIEEKILELTKTVERQEETIKILTLKLNSRSQTRDNIDHRDNVNSKDDHTDNLFLNRPSNGMIPVHGNSKSNSNNVQDFGIPNSKPKRRRNREDLSKMNI